MSAQIPPEQIASYVSMLVEIAAQESSSKHLGGICQKLSSGYRALGISSLLRDANIDRFFHGLIQSALIRRYFLERCHADGNSSAFHRRSGLSGPFFDAITASQWRLARRIGALSAETWMRGEEYEDDFAYARFLSLLIAPERADTAELERIIAQFEQAIQGDADVRFDLCGALLSRDQDKFDTAFAGLLVEHELHTKKQKKSITARDFIFENNSQIMVEGLAILNIANSLGLQTKPEYKFCPGLVRRVASYAPFVPQSFPPIRLDD